MLVQYVGTAGQFFQYWKAQHPKVDCSLPPIRAAKPPPLNSHFYLPSWKFQLRKILKCSTSKSRLQPISYSSSNTTTTISLSIQNSSNIKRNGQCGCSPLVKIQSLINALQARPRPRRQMHLFRKILPTILDQMTFPTRLSVCKTYTFLVINISMAQIILNSPLLH